MTNRLIIGLYWLLILYNFKPILTNQLTASSKAEELKQIQKLKLETDFLKKNKSNFYNYTIICGGKTFESRVDQTFSDKTIPIQFKNFVLETFLKPENRANKCPKWSYNVDTQPRSGGMDSLSIPENTKPGQKVFLLLAIDPESEPLFYFIRRAESETGPDDDPDDVIFKVNIIKMGDVWIGEVLLDKELDYEKKQSYNYLTYAYDGSNLLEKYTTIEITDVDDEKPDIKIDHPNYNSITKQFEFQVYENASIGEIINSNAKILFNDTDTQSSQLIIRLTNYESGIADSPFNVNNNGELRLISSLDYETYPEYLLKLNVRDITGGFSEEIIKIEVLDVPDLTPKFVEPKNLMLDSNRNNFRPSIFINRQFDNLKEEGYVLFYENKIGPVFNILAVSANKEPLGTIQYELIEDSTFMKGYFELRKHTKNDTWYLDCIKEFSLDDKEEEFLQFTIRAIESSDTNPHKSLFTDKKVIVKVINGDMCLPTFDKPFYEFEVVENVRQLLEPIYVSDCDHGVNGKINLTTTNKDFSFKLDQVYRYSKLGIYMAKSYDYEQNITIDGHVIEFEIIARGSEKSLNKYETRASVRVRILDMNEFIPKFVLPVPAYFLKDGIPTEQQQRIFHYNVPEGKDFVIDVKAEDQDQGGDNELVYSCRYLHPDDSFQIDQSYNSTTKLYNIKIPGRYFDSTSRIPITFAVTVSDNGNDMKLKNEIIINLKAQSAEQHPAYFEFPQYEFKLKEKSDHFQMFRLKLINENLNASKIKFEEISDHLNLFSVEIEENWMNKNEIISLVENDYSPNDSERDVNLDLFFILYPTNSSRDFDQLFIDNEKSDIYEYKLRVRLVERPDLYNDVTVYFKLIDSNDNQPELINVKLGQDEYLNATLVKDFVQNTLININESHFIPKLQDLDFSDEYGLKSLHCRVNDTRFYMDNEYISAELEHRTSSVSVLVRVLTNPENINKETIWLNISCEDNYFNRKSKFNSIDFLIKLNIIESESDRQIAIFDRDQYVFSIDENWTGVVGKLGNFETNKNLISFKIEGYSHEQSDRLNQIFYMEQNQLVLREKLDFESSDKILNFTVTASVKSLKTKTDLVVLVNDLNDEKPKMSQNELSIVLSQNHKSKGMVIGNLYAIDKDKEDSLIGLKFKSTSDKFTFEKINTTDAYLHGVSIILATDLDDDQEFEIIVIDNNSHTDKCKVIISIKNEQVYDEIKWSNETYEASVDENSPLDTFVVKVNIEPKGLKAKNAKIGYKIINTNPYFKINEQTGEIVTSNVKLDREDTNFINPILFVQAYLTVDSTTYWSNMIFVKINVNDINDEQPIFLQPSNNQTQISKFIPENVYTFKAFDSDKNDIITYNLIEQILTLPNLTVSLPFKIDSQTGVLSFNITELSNEDYMTLLKHESEYVRVKLTVQAIDSSGKSTTSNILVDLSINKLLRQTNKVEHLTPIIYKLEPKSSNLLKLNDSDYVIDESVQPNTIIAELNSYVSDRKIPLSESFKIVSNNDTIHSPDLYFKYDYATSHLKLIRKLDHDLVKNLSLALISDDDFTIQFNFTVNDTNNKPPELELDEQEMEKYGENLIVVSINNLANFSDSISRVISSTPLPPRKAIPAMPELNLPERPVNSMPQNSQEFDDNLNSLDSFNKIKLIKSYKISDTDKNNNFTVKFDLNGTSEAVARSYTISSNGSHVLIEKKDPITPEDEAILEENLHNRFKIELSDGKNVNYFTGELYRIDARQLQRLSNFVPKNGRYRSSIYRSAISNTKINLDPMIQIENPFPYDIFVELEGKHSKLFNVAPRVIRSSSSLNFGPTELVLSLKESMEEHEEELAVVTSIDISVNLMTKNDYLNILMKTIGNLKVKIDLKNENKYQPRIQSVEPFDRKIVLDEGLYLKKYIGKIEAYDNDRGDPGRLEYFLIGNSNFLSINSTTGEIYLNGTLDAESEQSMVFFCYARDLAPVPLGRNSELQRFEISVNDINEFKPIIQPARSSLTIKEMSDDFIQEEKIVDEFRFDCYDRDFDSNLEISLMSIQYVNRHDIDNFIDVPKPYQIKDIFKLIYENSTNKNYKIAYLSYTNKLDYEKLYRPNETLIRVDVTCSDGNYESLSKLIVKIEDINDNAPIFINKNMVVNKNESNLLETIVRVQAFDNDLSAQFGNQSLKYNIIKCTPNTFEIYIDERTGDISSKLLLDLDTEEVIEKRKQIYNDQLNYTEELDFLTNHNRIQCQISVQDAGLYGTPSESSLMDKMNLTILINNVNDNPPDIRLDKQNENSIEVKEGEQTRGAILEKISVFDKDGASDLECLFGNGFKTSDPFELRTSLDSHDPHICWCVLKVRDDMIVDYDIVKRSIYLLEIVVNDKTPLPVYPNKGVSRAQVRIRVIPVNNKPPIFVNGNEETFNVLDTIRPNTFIGTVLATDMENPNPDRLHYDLDRLMTSTLVCNKFELRSKDSTGSYWGSVGIYTKQKLEVSESPYILTIVAYDGPVELKDTLSSRKIIKINVLNKGSMSVWMNETNGLPVDYYSVSLEEGTPINTPVLIVKAKIPDQTNSDTSEVSYSIISENNVTNPFYKINEVTGEIRTIGEIDYEINNDSELVKQMRNLKIRATSSDALFTYTTHVSINVLDTNDNRPKFDHYEYKFCVVENMTDMTTVGFVKATDLDSGLNGLVKYKLINEENLFIINELTGELKTLTPKKIDRETNSSLKLEIIAYDTDDNEDKLELEICVLDINDNSPIFDKNLTTDYEINENSNNFRVQLNATDADYSLNGSVYFYFDKEINSIEITQKFRIEPLTGLVELLSPLDYETKQSYDLTITCSDNGIPDKLRTNFDLKIRVLDLNDNAPEFTNKNPGRIFVNEEIKAGEVLLKLDVIDKDLTQEFNEIRYKIRSIQYLKSSSEYMTLGSELFLVNSKGELILGDEQKLDYQKYREYRVEIEAYDSNKPELSNLYTLNINVEPSNNKLPVFEHFTGGSRNTTLYRRSLAESRNNDYVVDIVKAVDPNQHGIKYYLDSVIEYDINNHEKSRPNDLFSIGLDDGAVKTRKIRSLYSGDSYELTIRAVSKLNESLSSSTKLIVKIDTESDSLFEQRVIEIFIDENIQPKKPLTQLKPKAQDRSLKYKINTNYSSPEEYALKWFTVNYDTGLIQTTDNSNIDCEIVDEVLLSVDVLDEEDSLIENLLTRIQINDLNDNYPIFDQSYNYEPSVFEDDETDVDKERVITKFKAIDADRTENNSAISYSIEIVKNMNLKSFRLEKNSFTGEVTLIKTKGTNLDRDLASIGSIVRVQIRAENTFKPSIYSQKEIIIHLLDLNDNPPTFYDSSSEQIIFLLEDYPLGDKFYQVKAYDLDEINNVNSQLVYEIAPKSCGVDIDSQGYLYLIRQLDFEDKKIIEFTVSIYDKSSKPLFSSKKIKLNVENVNDNPPKFENLPNEYHDGECSFSIVENMDPKRILEFMASDRDFVQNPIFEFKLIDLKSFDHKTRTQIEIDNNFFRLDPNTGELFLRGQIDREQFDSYTMRLKVSDREINGKKLDSFVDCNIKILDVNDNNPQFSPSIQGQYKVLPLVNERTLIGYFSASDRDLGSNATVEYSLIDSKNNLFEIDSFSYLFINLKKMTDKNHDLDDVYDLEILARDFGSPKRLETTLKIRVQIDSNYFTFDQRKTDRLELQTPDVILLNENSEPGTKIGYAKVLNSFNAVINEAKSNNQNRVVDLKFKLLTCNDTFKIDEKSGLIEVKNSKKLDYETIKEFLIKVEAVEIQQMNTYSKRRYGVSNFMVKLLNLNDNPPNFFQEIYETSIKENQTLFDNILNLLISVGDLDLDSQKSEATNQLNPIEVRITGEDSLNFRLVQLNQFMFNIKSLHTFDYEFQKRYEFNLTAWDGLHKSFAKVIVNILDENDNRPRFVEDQYVFRIDENSPAGTEVGQLKAVDLDQSEKYSKIYYQITNTQDNAFSINTDTGLITVRNSLKLDREQIDSFNLIVKAFNDDRIDFFDTVKVIIFLNDLNDETPSFIEHQKVVNVREKLEVLPKYLTKVQAIDNDLGNNGEISYSISSINNEDYDLTSDKNLFYVDTKTGVLYLNAYLDAEDNLFYDITIFAKDNGDRSDKCNVLVNLIDINDLPPIVKYPQWNEIDFEENSPIDKPILEVVAFDPDPKKSKITYSIDQDIHNDSVYFTIDPNTGKVYSKINFDFETKNEYKIKILCKDTGIMINEEEGINEGTVNDLKRSINYELVTEYRIHILITDVDDNEPEFTYSDLFKVNISENLQPGSKVTVLPTALDRDLLSEHTNVKYYFIRGDFLGRFSLNENTGEIILLDELERKEKNVYNLTVQATSQHQLNTSILNSKSILEVQINVVQDKLFIEFDEQEYYVSVSIDRIEPNTNNSEKIYKVEDLVNQQSAQVSINLDTLKKSAIFCSKSHLIKRKIRRSVKYNIEMLQIVRQNEKLKTKLPINLVSKITQNEPNIMFEDLKFKDHLFLINETSGKVYINREMLKKENYRVGDRFLLTISASSPSPFSDETENTLTELTVRLTDKNYSIIKPIENRTLEEITFESLNPLDKNYIPRILQADGVKIVIQDLIPYKSELTGKTAYYLIMQVEARQEKQSLDLDLFMKIWKNYSPSSSGILNEMNFIDPRPLSNARQIDHSDLFSIYRPFYTSWLFWLLFLIGCLLVLILLFFVFCIRQNHKQHKNTKKPGIIIEYPPGVNPMYNDGVLSLNNNSKPNHFKRKIVPVDINNSPQTVNSENDYEEKEFKIDFESEEDV